MKGAFLPIFLLVCMGAQADWRILCVGDSITQGGRGYGSYREPLAQLLDGWPVQWTGSLTTTYTGEPSLPHEGRWGYTVERWLRLHSDVLRSHQGDIVLLLLGTNDCSLGYSSELTLSRLEQMVWLLREANPRVVVLIGKLIPRQKDPAFQTLWNEVNEGLPTLAAALDSPESRVMFVDLGRGFDTATFTYDGTHPNAEGESLLAIQWYEALCWVPYLLTDINMDGWVNAYDVQLTINATLAGDPSLCDIDRDGRMTAIDVQMCVNAALGRGHL